MQENNMAQKIKDLRISQKMTLEDVANKVGVGKSTVRKWEVGMIANMRRDKIKALADALGTTPEYLMGWETKNKKEEIINKLTSDEESILELYRDMNEDQKELIKNMMIAISQRGGKDERM